MMLPGEILFVFRARMKDRAWVVLELLAVLGIAVGVALLFSSQVAATSLDSTVRGLASQVVGSTQYQIDSRGPEGFSVRLVSRVEHLPGVTLALPLLDQQATVVGPVGSAAIDLIGADSRFARAGSRLLRHFTAKQLEHQQALALPAPLASQIGAGSLQTVKVQVGSRITESLVGATLTESDIGGLVHGSIAVAPLSYAQGLAGMRGKVTRIFIRVRPGQETQARASLQSLATKEHLNLAPADFDAQLFSVASAPAEQGQSLFSAISAFVGFLFSFTAMLLTVPGRRKLIEAMRRRGTTRSMMVQLLSFDALVLGLIACAVGLGLGEFLSARVFSTRPGYLAFAFPVGTQRVVTWETIALSVGAGMLAAFAGVLAPVRTILARPLQSSIAAERAPRGLTAMSLGIGAGCLAVTTGILFLRPQSAVLGAFTLVLALTCLLPFLFRGVVSLFSMGDQHLATTSPKLAVIELRDPLTRVRSLAVAATGALAVFGSVAIQGAQHNLQAGLDRATVEWNHVPDLWISPAGAANTLGTTPFPSSIVGKLTRLASVQTASIYRGSFLTFGDRRLWVIAPPRSAAQPVPSGQLTSGTSPDVVSARLRGHGWAVISEAIANELHLRPGGFFTLPSPVPTRFRVAGLSTNGGWPPGAVIINADDYARAWGSSAASALQVSLRSGVSPEQGRLEAQKALGSNSGLAVQTAREREQEWETGSRQGLARLTQIATLVLIAAVLAMAGVMSSMALQRRDQLAYIKRQGFDRGLLWRAVVIQSAILLGAGCSIGAVFGVYGELVISHALATVTGFPIAISAETNIALGSFGVVWMAALAIVAIPGYLAVRVRASTIRPA